jgi:hypothetical protein
LSANLTTKTVQAVIKKAESLYQKNTDRVKYLQTTINNFNAYAKKNPEYKDFVSQIVSQLKAKIEEYNNAGKDSIFPMFDNLY